MGYQTRRELLKTSALTIAAMGLAACGQPQTAESTYNWPKLQIPANHRLQRIPNVDTFQSTDIGIRGLYLLNHSRIPLVAIYVAYDDAVEFLEYTSASFGFQAVREGFSPVTPLVQDSRRKQIGPKEIAQFQGDAIHLVRESDSQRKNGMLLVKFRPEDPTTPQTLVFEKGLVRFQRNLSPQAYLRTKLIFETPGRVI